MMDDALQKKCKRGVMDDALQKKCKRKGGGGVWNAPLCATPDDARPSLLSVACLTLWFQSECARPSIFSDSR